MKLISVHNATIRHHTATGNSSYGLWLDTDNRQVTIQDSRICGNRLAGLVLEASQGPITVHHATICRNGERGIVASNASNVTVSDSDVLDNATAQVTLSGVQNGRLVTDWESKRQINVLSSGWTVRHNRVHAGKGQLLVDNTWSAATWTAVRHTYAWTGNNWTSSDPKAFRLLGSYRLGTLADWRAATGLDRRSQYQAAR